MSTSPESNDSFLINNFITNNLVTNNTVTNNITNIIVAKQSEGASATDASPSDECQRESILKMADDVVERIERIQHKATGTEVFDDAFALLLKLKLVMPV